MESVESFDHKGFTVHIYHDDEEFNNPRTNDDCNLGTMVCFHGRYRLGDKHEFQSPADLDRFLSKKSVICLPMFMYDHSGITINTTGFSCPWDSGQIGYIYTTKEKIREFYGISKVTKTFREQALGVLNQEVKTYDQYLTGDVYMFVIEKNDEVVDSCCGFFGLEYALESAKESAEACFKSSLKDSLWRV